MERKGCHSISEVEKDGRVIARDILLERENGTVIITVGTQEYLDDLKNHRQRDGLPPPTEHEIFLLNDLTTADVTCQSILSIPPEVLQLYLVPQTPATDVQSAQ